MKTLLATLLLIAEGNYMKAKRGEKKSWGSVVTLLSKPVKRKTA